MKPQWIPTRCIKVSKKVSTSHCRLCFFIQTWLVIVFFSLFFTTCMRWHHYHQQLTLSLLMILILLLLLIPWYVFFCILFSFHRLPNFYLRCKTTVAVVRKQFLTTRMAPEDQNEERHILLCSNSPPVTSFPVFFFFCRWLSVWKTLPRISVHNIKLWPVSFEISTHLRSVENNSKERKAFSSFFLVSRDTDHIKFHHNFDVKMVATTCCYSLHSEISSYKVSIECVNWTLKSFYYSSGSIWYSISFKEHEMPRATL